MSKCSNPTKTSAFVADPPNDMNGADTSLARAPYGLMSTTKSFVVAFVVGFIPPVGAAYKIRITLAPEVTVRVIFIVMPVAKLVIVGPSAESSAPAYGGQESVKVFCVVTVETNHALQRRRGKQIRG